MLRLRRNGPVVKSWGHAVLRLEGSLWCVMSNEYGTDKTTTVTVTGFCRSVYVISSNVYFTNICAVNVTDFEEDSDLKYVY